MEACEGPEAITWLPVVLDLKRFKVSQLGGLLHRYLRDPEWCGLPPECVTQLREGATLPGVGRVGLLVLCDGFDEVQGEVSEVATAAARRSLTDLYCRLCGEGLAWSTATLRVIVTSRESRLKDRGEESVMFGRHQRCLLLPSSMRQVGGPLKILIGFAIVEWKETVFCSYGQQRDKGVNVTTTARLALQDGLRELWCGPFGAQIRQYLECRTGEGGGGAFGSVTLPTAPHGPTRDAGVLPSNQYLLVLESSPSILEMVRNPFVLRLYVDALPTLQSVSRMPWG